MDSATDHPFRNLSRVVQSASSNLSTILAPKQQQPPPPLPSTASCPPSKLCLPFLFPDSQLHQLTLSLASEFDATQQSPDSLSSPSSSSSSIKNMTSQSSSRFPSTVRISGLKSTGKAGGGPAFVGQVFSMCDLSGTGLMAVSTHFDIPFISQRTPEWLKKMFAAIMRSERNGPVFRFFMDLGDAVSYVKRLNIPSGVVGACRLDIAFEHFKEKPHLFQFVPNEKQVKEANKLLKMIPQSDGRKKVDGVPVFSAQNLDIAIATTDGIKWYTPYFFDKSMLDNILEESVDQHFHSLIQTRNLQRRRDIVDDNLPAEVVEEMGDSIWEPPEVQEVLDEIGHPGIPLSVISKAAEIQLLYAVDKVLLGNRWLRKATGIQPKFPYMVDSFEKRSAASCLKACVANYNIDSDSQQLQRLKSSEIERKDNFDTTQDQRMEFRLPFANWLSLPWLNQQLKQWIRREEKNNGPNRRDELLSSPFLPKITMVGISTGEAGQMSKATLKKTMDDLTKELERTEQQNLATSSSNEYQCEERDPLFVANVGDYYSGLSKRGSARWVRGGSS